MPNIKWSMARRIQQTVDPFYRTFCNQRANAKTRGIPWELAYWEWLQIWQDSGHLHERGVRRGEWVMARNGDTGPYAANNVKIVTNHKNCSDGSRGWHAKNSPRGTRVATQQNNSPAARAGRSKAGL